MSYGDLVLEASERKMQDIIDTYLFFWHSCLMYTRRQAYTNYTEISNLLVDGLVLLRRSYQRHKYEN